MELESLPEGDHFMNCEKIVKLTECVTETIRQLEMRLGGRGWTTGKKQWELKLLFMAYEAADTPKECRMFGLDKIKTLNEIKKQNDW